MYDATLHLKWTENRRIIPSYPAVRIRVSSHENEVENIGDGEDEDDGGNKYYLNI